MESLLKLLDDTALNSMVIDLKDDNGYITYPTQNPDLLKLGKPQKYIGNIGQSDGTSARSIKYTQSAGSSYSKIRYLPEAILSFPSYVRTASIWENGKGDSFVNPYMKEVWDYNIAIAKEAVKLGFKEIQFDYVRFPEGFEKKADSLEV